MQPIEISWPELPLRVFPNLNRAHASIQVSLDAVLSVEGATMDGTVCRGHLHQRQTALNAR